MMVGGQSAKAESSCSAGHGRWRLLFGWAEEEERRDEGVGKRFKVSKTWVEKEKERNKNEAEKSNSI
jgi:hypothetical protein